MGHFGRFIFGYGILPTPLTKHHIYKCLYSYSTTPPIPPPPPKKKIIIKIIIIKKELWVRAGLSESQREKNGLQDTIWPIHPQKKARIMKIWV